MTAVAVQTSLFEHGRTCVQCCKVFLYSTFVSYCTLHSTNCIQFRKFTQNQFYMKSDEHLYCAVCYDDILSLRLEVAILGNENNHSDDGKEIIDFES